MISSLPPTDCPNCNGQREWSGDAAFAMCMFCGLTTKGEPEQEIRFTITDLGRRYLRMVELFEASPWDGGGKRAASARAAL